MERDNQHMFQGQLLEDNNYSNNSAFVKGTSPLKQIVEDERQSLVQP